MSFDPIWGWVSLGLFGLCLWDWWRSRGRRPGIGFGSLALLPRLHRGPKPLVAASLPYLRLAALACLLAALAQPRFGVEAQSAPQSGLIMELVLDRSGSMAQGMDWQGTEVTRLDAAREVFTRFLLGDGPALPGRAADLAGLIAFAGFVDEVSPLSRDHQTLAHLAQGLTTAPRPEDGTMIGDALQYAILRLLAAEEELTLEGQIQSRLILLLTDGQQTQGGLSPLEAAQLAQEKGIKIYVVALVPSEGFFSGGIFGLLNHKPDTSMVRHAAEATGGAYFEATTGAELQQVYQEINRLEPSRFREAVTQYKQAFGLFLWPGVLLLLLELSLDILYLRKV